jgi:hypothetical protein
MHDLKSGIKISQFLHLHHFISSTPPFASNTQKVTHHVPDEVEEALDDNKDMTYNLDEEDHEERHCRNRR